MRYVFKNRIAEAVHMIQFQEDSNLEMPLKRSVRSISGEVGTPAAAMFAACVVSLSDR